LQKYLQHYGIDAKIHYPIPLHLQKAAKSLNYKKNDFPVAESVCRRILSLPVHEFISKSDLDFMIKKIFDFYHE
jgi:dTDP-4-amino-4,6-dideoxygalactose transaminase